MRHTLTCTSLILILASCMVQKSSLSQGEMKGVLGLFEGNCMPAPDQPSCIAQPMVNTLFIALPSANYEERNLVDSVVSSANGKYSIRLPAGTYSLFLKDGKDIVCPVIQCPDQCVCAPVVIAADSTTIMNLNLDRATW